MKSLLFFAACIAVIYGQAIQDNLLECTNGPGYYPHPKSCLFFYICKEHQDGNLEKFVFRCAPGTLYDPETQVCTLEQFVNCNGEPKPLPSTKAPLPSTKAPIKKKIKTTPIPVPTTPAPFQCKRDGFYRNPQDCNIFIQCHKFPNGTYTTHNFNCPQGSFYNQEGPNPECVSPTEEQPLPKNCPPLKR